MTKKENYHGLSNEDILLIYILVKGLVKGLSKENLHIIEKGVISKTKLTSEEIAEKYDIIWIITLKNIYNKLKPIVNLLLDIKEYKDYYEKTNVNFINF